MAVTLYVDRSTALHRRHPLAKLIAMTAFFFIAFLTDRPLLLLPMTILVLTMIGWAGAFGNVRRLRALFVMVSTMAFVMWILFYRGGGEPWWTLGPLTLSRPQLEFAAGMALKLFTFLSIGVLFLSTTTIEEFAHALVQAGIPYRLGFTITLAFRLVPVFVDSAMTVVQAQRSRGFDFEQGNLLERARRYVPVIVPVFIGALRRADGMAMALEARGFQRRSGRTSYTVYKVRSGDVALVVLSVAVAALYFFLWRRGLTTVPIR